MPEEYKKKIGIPDHHDFKMISSDWKAKKGQETNNYVYHQIDKHGEFIAAYKIKYSTSMYPPFGHSISWKKI